MLTFDSLDQWRQAAGAPWVDVHPVAHTALVWISATLGSPAWLVAAQQLGLAAGAAALVLAVLDAGADRITALATGAAVFIAPSVGLFSVAVWKDVPFTAAALWLAAELLRSRGAGADPAGRRRLLLAAVLVLLLRQNGFVLVASAGVALALAGRSPGARRFGGGLALGAPALFLLLRALVWPTLGVQPAPPSSLLPVAVHDVAAILHSDPPGVTPSEVAALDPIAPRRTWFERYDCSSVHPLLNDPAFRASTLDADPAPLRAAWRSMVRRDPGAWVQHRVCASALAWRPMWRGGEWSYLASRAIEPNELGLESRPLALDDVLNRYADLGERPVLRGLLWRAPFWMVLALIAVAVATRRGRPGLWVVLAVPVGQALAVVLANPGQDARYMAAAGMVSVLLLPLATASARDEPRHPVA
ncbi:MAG: hypothetical protein GY898_15675 [Proteobacteria bacterium]|nr:hypothetical protein [Pseudomonadota bacterium]